MPRNRLWESIQGWRNKGKKQEEPIQPEPYNVEPSNFGTASRKRYERRTDEAFLSSLHPQVRGLYEQGELDYADHEFLVDCVPMSDRVPGSSASTDSLDETQPPVGLMRDADVENGTDARWLIAQTPLGEGGMNQVFKGWDLNLSRPVAVKKMKMNTNSKLLRDATAIEAKTMARLRHKNMPRIDGLMLDADGALLYMMELFNPEQYQLSLEVKGQVSASQLATFVTELCDYEDYCRKLRLYHRDLKLGNVFIDKVTGSPRIFDMGISNWSLEPAMGAGTPSTMSPERWTNSEKPEEMFESEVFAIGTMLYNLITGLNKYGVPKGLPFHEAKSKMKEIILNQPQLEPAQEDLVKEKCRELGINGDVVVKVLNTCLAKLPQDRYHSGDALAREFLSAYPKKS